MGLEGVGQRAGGGGSLRRGLGAGDRRRPGGKRSGARTRPHKDCGGGRIGTLLPQYWEDPESWAEREGQLQGHHVPHTGPNNRLRISQEPSLTS